MRQARSRQPTLAATRLLLTILPLLLCASAEAEHPRDGDFGDVRLSRFEPVIDAVVAGLPTRLAVTLDPGIYLASPFAQRLAINWQPGASEYVGRVLIRHRTAAGDVTIAGVITPAILQTQDAPCCGGHDGAIGATELPWSIVRIGTAGPQPERRYPTTRKVESGLSIPWRIGRATINVVLSPDAPVTVATASAAAILSRAYGGRLANEAREVPVAYGVARPVRDMALGQATTLIGFRLDHVAVRIGDYAGDTDLPQSDLPPPRGTDEIVVSHRPPPPQFRWAAITVGRDLLDRCSQISVYRDEAQIGLVCASP